jgi:hypothetical protein
MEEYRFRNDRWHATTGRKTREIGVRQGTTQPGAPAHGGAGARLAGMRPGSGMQAHRHNRVLVHTYAVASPKGPLLCASVRTPGEDSERSMASILVGFSATN